MHTSQWCLYKHNVQLTHVQSHQLDPFWFGSVAEERALGTDGDLGLLFTSRSPNMGNLRAGDQLGLQRNKGRALSPKPCGRKGKKTRCFFSMVTRMSYIQERRGRRVTKQGYLLEEKRFNQTSNLFALMSSQTTQSGQNVP